MQLRLLFEDSRTASWLLRAAEGDSPVRIWPWVWQSGRINLTISFLSGGAHSRKRACRAFYSNCQLDVNPGLWRNTQQYTLAKVRSNQSRTTSLVSFRFGSERQELREVTEEPASSLLGANSAGYRRHLIRTDRRSQCTLVSRRNS